MQQQSGLYSATEWQRCLLLSQIFYSAALGSAGPQPRGRLFIGFGPNGRRSAEGIARPLEGVSLGEMDSRQA